nr:hypothetical protein [Tanacetum cinerariifolium]
MDTIFNKNRFSSVPRLSLRIPNGTNDIGCLVVLKKATKEVVQQPGLERRKIKKNRTLKDFRPEFQLYLIEGTRDEVSDQHSYCFNIEDDPKIFDEAMKSLNVAFWKEAINDEMDSIMGNNTWVLADLPPGCKPFGCKWIFKRKPKMDVKTAFLNGNLDEEVYMNQPQGFIMSGNENKVYKLTDKCVYSKFDETSKGVIICLDVDDMLIFSTDKIQVDLTNEFLSSMFFVKDMGEANVILVLEGYTNATWIRNTEDNLSTSGWVFLLSGGVIYWVSKKQTCITGSRIESKFVALVTAGKEAEWLKNLLLEILLLSKPITHIFIFCDSAATLERLSQMYNRKFRHLGETQLPTKETWWLSSMWKAEHSMDRSTCFTIIPMICLEPAEKEDEVVIFLMVNLFEKLLSRSMNKEEPPE